MFSPRTLTDLTQPRPRTSVAFRVKAAGSTDAEAETTRPRRSSAMKLPPLRRQAGGVPPKQSPRKPARVSPTAADRRSLRVNAPFAKAEEYVVNAIESVANQLPQLQPASPTFSKNVRRLVSAVTVSPQQLRNTLSGRLTREGRDCWFMNDLQHQSYCESHISAWIDTLLEQKLVSAFVSGSEPAKVKKWALELNEGQVSFENVGGKFTYTVKVHRTQGIQYGKVQVSATRAHDILMKALTDEGRDPSLTLTLWVKRLEGKDAWPVVSDEVPISILNADGQEVLPLLESQYHEYPQHVRVPLVIKKGTEKSKWFIEEHDLDSFAK